MVSCRTLLLTCVVANVWAHNIAATEIVLQNDSLGSASQGTPLLAFLQGERAANWHTAPLAGTIVGVQVVWGTLFGGGSDSTEFAIHIYDGGTFPDPAAGAPLATISTPVLTDGTSSGTINEFRFLDPPTDGTPLSVSVSKDQDFIVALEFFNTNDGQSFAPSVKYDGETCAGGTSTAFAIPGGWADACLLGVPGNLGIRAILDVTLTPGDFDVDGDVDGDDFLLWQSDPSVGSLADWEENYGTVATLSATAAAVPEPTTTALALVALCLAMGRRRAF